jgi:hypothetical protein
MSFWDLSDGGSAAENIKDEYEIAGNMDPIPHNSDCLAVIKKAEWAFKGEDGDEVSYVNVQWQVEAPDAYKNRTVFQKLWVDDLDPGAKDKKKAIAKRDKARQMLATIDGHARGKLVRATGRPTSDDMAMALVDAKMVIKVMLWELNDGARGNWVSAIKGKDAETSEGEPLPTKKAASGGGYGSGGRPSGSGGSGSASPRFDLDDEIPFSPEVRV